MKDYAVHFSFYAETSGRFDCMFYMVAAETSFDARAKAWLLYDKDDAMRLTSCVKQTGVTWDSSPLDIQDYFNANMARCQQSCRVIKDIVIQNALIEKDDDTKQAAERSLNFEHGMAYAIQKIAMDHYAHLHIIPPIAFEAIAYTEKLLHYLYTQPQYNDVPASGLYELIENAKRNEPDSVQALQRFLENGSIEIDGESYNFNEHFKKDGICPLYADINDYAGRYIARWSNINPFRYPADFDERYVISGSAETMPYEYKTLVLKKDVLALASQKPMYLLWETIEPENRPYNGYGTNPDRQIVCENKITGHHAVFRRADFHGVLRPEFEQRIDYDKLKADYEALPEQVRDADVMYISSEPTREAAYSDESEDEGNYDTDYNDGAIYNDGLEDGYEDNAEFADEDESEM